MAQNHEQVTLDTSGVSPASATPRRPSKKAPKKAKEMPTHTKRDGFIMDTNNSSIVSKRSVEKLYHADEPEYFRYFVRKFQRRAPLINRGYWLRMKAVDYAVRDFLQTPNGKHKLVINLGCGYDPLPFQYLGGRRELCDNCTFVDVDYPQLMQRKLHVIQQTPQLLDVLKDFRSNQAGEVCTASAEGYRAFACDLRHLDRLHAALEKEFSLSTCSVAILFVAEVSVAYMDPAPANALLKWASTLPDAKFCLLEQHLPDGRDHPFAQTMLKHFDKLRTPLNAIGTIDQMRDRFVTAGWPANRIGIRTLWELWSDPAFLTNEERQKLDTTEPFDEWEEFALFGSHYFLLVAANESEPIISPRSGLPEAVDDKCLAGNLNDESTASIQTMNIGAYHRRFGASMSAHSRVQQANEYPVIAHCGGLGSRERLTTCDTLVPCEEHSVSPIPSMSTSLMCHTITPVGHSGRNLLVGGRTSPDKASRAGWLFEDGQWKRVHDLPDGRFRHNAVSVDFKQEDGSSVPGVLIGFGKNSAGIVLADWLLWTEESGWQKVEVSDNSQQVVPRFGAAMSIAAGSQFLKGLIVGGMSQDGRVLDEVFDWHLTFETGQSKIAFFENREFLKQLSKHDQSVGRFGASLTWVDGRQLLIGGVAAGRMLNKDEEIVDLQTCHSISIQAIDRPLMVGCSVQMAESTGTDGHEELLILGGGATCFSFGTFWNSCYTLTSRHESQQKPSWRLVQTQHLRPDTTQRSIPSYNHAGISTSQPSKPGQFQVPRIEIRHSEDFNAVRQKAAPAVLSGLKLGKCVERWASEYLKEQIGPERQVVIHDSPTPHMNFQSKNFSYSTISFSELIDRATSGSHVYLRALSADKPADRPTKLVEDFPAIASDFQLPQELAYVTQHEHSSPFRISGPVTMWLHYDVMANVLCQIRGSKRLLLYPPSDVSHLGFVPGASSSNINPFIDSPNEHPGLQYAHSHEAILHPGDILFIPPLWLHTAEPTDGLSVAVNVFFRDDTMEAGYAAGKDVYGNRDMAMYERARRDLQRIQKSFEPFPEHVRTFYMSRLADELRQMSGL